VERTIPVFFLIVKERGEDRWAGSGEKFKRGKIVMRREGLGLLNVTSLPPTEGKSSALQCTWIPSLKDTGT
jgi:hypothetical protein